MADFKGLLGLEEERIFLVESTKKIQKIGVDENLYAGVLCIQEKRTL